MPTTMIEMMLTLDPVMYIMKPCIASVLAGDCAIPMAICDGMVVGEEPVRTRLEWKEGKGKAEASLHFLSGRAAIEKRAGPPRSSHVAFTQPGQIGT